MKPKLFVKLDDCECCFLDLLQLDEPNIQQLKREIQKSMLNCRIWRNRFEALWQQNHGSVAILSNIQSQWTTSLQTHQADHSKIFQGYVADASDVQQQVKEA